MRKRITSLLLTLAMLCSLLPAMGVTASAAEPEWKIVNTYDELEAALSNQNPPDNIKLGADIDTEALHSSMGIIESLEVKGSKKLDLNGHTLRMYSAKTGMSDMITIEYGDLTVLDSSSGQKGTILGSTYKDSCYLINVRTNGQFTLNSGTLKVDADSHSGKPWWKRVIYCYAGGTVTINGGTLHVAPETYENEKHSYGEDFEQGYADLLNGYCGYTLMAADSCKVTINGGTFEGPVRLDAGGSKWNKNEPRVTITNGTFEKKVMLNGAGDGTRPLTVISGGKFLDYVQAWAAASFDEKNPFTASEVTVNGGEFHDTFWIRPTFPSSDIVSGGARRGYHLSARLMSATIYKCITADPDIIDLYKVYVDGKQDNSQKTVNDIYNLASEVLDRSAVQNNNGCFSPLDTASYRQMFSYRNTGKPETEGYLFELKALGDTPTKIIPNAWGVMKPVTLDGTEINYAKDWKGAFERMDNSTAHTLKFEWEPLAQALKDAGYSYAAKCEHYIFGASGVQQTDEIAADKTSHTVTIPKGADPKVYSFDLQLNLQKDGDTVGIYTNDHNIVKLVVNEAPDTFISTVSFNLAKTEVGKPGELSFTATDVNGKPVAINPDVTWTPTNIQEGPNNHVSFKIPAPKGYTFSGKDGKTTALKFGGVDVIGYVDNTGALNFSFPLEVPHQHKVDHVSYNAKFHWDVCSCGQQIMNTGAKHNMGAWVEGATLSSGGVVYNRSCTSGCGYTETTIDYSGVKHVTSLVLNMENYPMDGMSPHNFVKNGSETPKDSDGEYLLTVRNSNIPYPSFSITSGGDKAKLYALNPEAYEVLADNPDFAMWSRNGSRLAPVCDDPNHDTHNAKSTFTTGENYGVRLFLEAEDGYAFYKDFNEDNNFKLFTDMDGIEVKNYIVEKWYYYSKRPSYDDDNVPEGWGWYTQAPDDDSAGASKVGVLFQLTARNEGELNITLPELKAGDDLKTTWADFEGIGAGNFVKDCYRNETMEWWGGPSCVIHSGAVTGASVTAQAGKTYRLGIPAVNANVLAHITIKNPTAATSIVESPDGAITVTYTLPAAADDKTVNGAAVSITPPAYGAAPSTVATVADTAHYTASPVTWNPADAAFEAKEYTATVTLTPKTDYTFADNAVFTINGYKATVTKNTDGSVALSYAFPALTKPHTHTYGGNWIFATPDTHIRYCTANDGSYEEAPHSIPSWTDKGDGKTHTGTCADCGYEKTENHSWVVVGEVAPTVDTEGSRSYKCSATGCTATKTESIPKLIKYAVTVTSGGNGSASANPATAAAGTEITLTAKADSGYHFKEWQVVKGGMTITNNKFTMPAENVEVKAIFEKNTSTGGGGGGGGVTTYPITVKSAKNGDVTASHKTASKGTAVTLTVNPDKGYVLDTLTVLDGKDKEIKLTEKNGKYTLTMPDSKVTVEAMFKAEQTTGKNPFIDVPAGSYYEDAVIWAVDKGITTGTSATTFNPNGICTRAQAVTFLWRAAGSPAAKSGAMPFADVKAGSYYYDAVLWAVENGITKGTSDTMFSPDATCTRAQIVTFLWRANGSPAVSGNSAFTDVASDAYYAAAVTWAEKNDVTGGIGGGLFGSGNDCTRAQIVTFIYRSVK